MALPRRICIECGREEMSFEHFLPMQNSECACTLTCYIKASRKQLEQFEKAIPGLLRLASLTDPARRGR